MSSIVRLYYEAYRGLPRMVWLLAGLIFVNRCGTMVLPFLAIYLNKVQGIDPSLAVQFLAVYGAGGVIGAYLGGWLTERVGAMRVVLGSLLLSAPAFIGMAFCSSVPQFVTVLFYLAVVAETIRPAIATATSEHSPPELLARSYALNRLAMNLGMSIGPAVGGVLAHWGYWFLLFSINGAFVSMCAVFTLVCFDLRAKPQRPQHAEDNGQGSPWADKPFLAFLAMQSLAGLVFFQIISTLPMYLSKQYLLGEDQIGLIFVLNTVLIVLFEMILTERLRRYNPLRIMAVGTALIGVGFGGAVFGSGFGFAAMLAVVWTAGEMLNAPFSITHVAQLSTGRNRGAYMGLNSVSHAVAFVGAPLLGGVLYRVNPQLPWWCCLATTLVLPTGFWWLARWSQAPSAGQQYRGDRAA